MSDSSYPTPQATFRLSIKANSGYEADTEGVCTPDQYSIAMAALHNTIPTTSAGLLRASTAMLAALIVAREFISTDRNAFADAAMPPDGRPMEEADAAELADYDAALLQINDAIEKAGAA